LSRKRTVCQSETASPVISRTSDADLINLLGDNYKQRLDEFDLIQLKHVIKVCRESDSMADAAKKLFAVSFKTKKSSNNSDRLSKYLAKFGLKFKSLR
jgi:transcriptional regulatory protein RtcR